MARIVVASASETSREHVSRLLSSSGFSVFRCCASGSELRRTINECEDGIVVLMGMLPDCKPDELQWDYGDHIQILLIAKPLVLESCDFKARIPMKGQTGSLNAAVAAAVLMYEKIRQDAPS